MSSLITRFLLPPSTPSPAPAYAAQAPAHSADPALIELTQSLLNSMHATHVELIDTLKSLRYAVDVNHQTLLRQAEPFDALHGAIQAVAAPRLAPAPSRGAAIAAFLVRWTTPVLQILLGATLVVAGTTIGEVALIAMGAANIVVGVGIIITMVASDSAPHPLDALKHYFERRHTPPEKPELYTEGLLSDI